MLIHQPKLLSPLARPPQRRTAIAQGSVTAITVALGMGLAQGWLGQGGEALALGLGQGVGLGLVWLGGEGLAWGVMAGMAIAVGTGLINAGGSLPLSLVTAILTGAIGGGSLILARRGLTFWEFSPLWLRLQDSFGFLAAGVGLTAVLTAIPLGLWALIQEPASLGLTIFRTALGSASGILLITPLLLKAKYIGRGFWRARSVPSALPTPKKWVEGLLCGAGIAVLAGLMFARRPLLPMLEAGGLGLTQWLEYLPFPLVVWASIRFPAWGGVLSTTALAGWAIAATVQGYGTFSLQSDNLSGAWILLQIYFLVLGTTSLLLSATVNERRRTENQLRASWERERLLAEVAQRVRQSLEVGQIFQRTVEEVRQLLKADRVYIALLNEVGQLEVKAESCDSAYPALLPPYSREPHYEETIKIIPAKVLVVHHPDQLPTGPGLKGHFRQYQVKALLAIPLATVDGVLGMIVAHHCRQPRHWQKGEVRLLEQLAIQVAIAIQQAQLYQQVQRLNANLEQQVAERTAQLNDKMLELQNLHHRQAVFVQAISHDLRTSGMGLLMVLRSLQAQPDETISLSRPILDRLIQSGDRQLTLLNALSAEQADEERPLNLQWKAISLMPFLQQLDQRWRSNLEKHNVSLTIDCPETVPTLKGDRHYLEQVFDNLLGNALKHNPPGIALTLTVQHNAETVRFTLGDNGSGMAADQCQNLFRLYLRNRHNQRLTGIGLGCYQARQIVEAHGGQIGVISTPGKGSQFWFTLPLPT